MYAPCDCNVTYTQSPDGSYVVNLSGTDFQGQIGGVTNIDTSLVKVKQGQRIGSAKGHLKIECDKNGEKPAQV